MLGQDIAEQLSRREPQRLRLRNVGVVSAKRRDGIPVWLNRTWLEADVRITTGFVEPHFFAGFSGGPKMVAPGLAGFDTIMHLHNAERIAHPDGSLGNHPRESYS